MDDQLTQINLDNSHENGTCIFLSKILFCHLDYDNNHETALNFDPSRRKRQVITTATSDENDQELETETKLFKRRPRSMLQEHKIIV